MYEICIWCLNKSSSFRKKNDKMYKKKHNKHHIPLILEVTKCGKSVLQLRK